MKAMKTIFNKVAGVAMVAALAGSMASCVSESPFSNEDGEGLVKMNVVMNTAVTRATPSNNQELLDKCVIYVSNEKGLLHKWTGVSNIPSELYLRYGSYTAEAWSGDSVSAAFESEGKKFYKGLESFSVDATQPTVQVNLSCTLANVVGSVDESTIDGTQVQDMKVTFSTVHGSLSFDADNWADKAYFMMSSADKNSEGQNVLNYVVEGKDMKGNSFTKPGVINNVKSAHEYRLKFEYDPAEPTDGGAFIQIDVDDTEVLVEHETHIYGSPVFLWEESDMEVGDQIVGAKGEFGRHVLRVAAYQGFKSVEVDPVDDSMFVGKLPQALSNTSYGFELTTVNDPNNPFSDTLEQLGIGIEYVSEYDAEAHADLCKYILVLGAEWLNSLDENEKPYELTVKAEDVNGHVSEMLISIANTQKAIILAAPVSVDSEALASDLTAVGSKSVTLPLTFDDSADLTNAALQYRPVGTTDWTTQPINLSRAVISTSVTLTDLTPDTDYEYRTVAGQIVDGEYELKSKVATFKTESVFIIPNASFEDWSSYSAKTMLGTKNVILPGSTGDKTTSFWGSGNEGAATANMTLTDKSTDMVHSGTYSARLESKSALGVIAAGNMFVGEYVKTDGTNGVLSVGREYDGSHPSSVSVWANYRPANSVKVNSENKEFIPEGFGNGNDHGQIYVALTTEAVELRTNPKDRKLFNPNGSEVVAYGEVTWTGNFGPDGSLEKVVIPLVYNDNAKTKKPTHIVIVATASKYGDYFTGAPGSVLYLDDFELVYE